MFFEENKRELIKQRYSLENQFITRLYSTLDGRYVLFSNIVGKVIFIINRVKGCYYFKGTVLCQISILGVNYTIAMEFDGLISAVYVRNRDIIEYSTPLFLITKP